MIPSVVTLLVLTLTGCWARNANIINGNVVNPPGKYPWQASLQQGHSGARHICGGSVLDNRWILTAAHCVENKRARDLSIVVGMHDQRGQQGQPKRYNIQQIVSHDRYNQGQGVMPNDIALIQVSRDIQMNQYVQPIAIDKDGEFDGSSTCVISGWGNTKTGGRWDNSGSRPAQVLQEASTRLLSPQECKANREVPGGADSIYPGIICVFTGRSGGCQGDSGGPLHCKNGNGQFKLVGATSWGLQTCAINSPTMYTRVSAFASWINEVRGVSDDTGDDSGDDSGDDTGDEGDDGTSGDQTECQDKFSQCRTAANLCWWDLYKKDCCVTCTSN